MVDRRNLLKGSVLVITSTLAVTVAFVGLLAMITARAEGFSGRFPFYIVASSVAFTVLVIVLERNLAEGSKILMTAVVLSVILGIVFALDIEGIFFASKYPGELVASQLILYFIAAGCLCTGLVYWSVHHWREFVNPPSNSG